MRRWWGEYSIQTQRIQTLKLLHWCCCFLVSILRWSEMGAFSHCVLCRYVEVFWLSPAAAPAPGHSCHPWQLSDGFLIFGGGGGLSAWLPTGRETFPAWCLARGVKSLCTTYFAFTPQRQLDPCMGNPSLSMEQGPQQQWSIRGACSTSVPLP